MDTVEKFNVPKIPASRRILTALLLLGLASCARHPKSPSKPSLPPPTYEPAKKPKPPPPSYTNPVYSGSMPDPSVIRDHEFYYAFGTTGNERTPDGRIFNVLRSKDLVNWVRLGGALLPPSTDTRGQYWAPEVTVNGGVFYLYYAVGGIEPEKFELRVATSIRPEGPYVDTGNKLIDCESNRFTIDPFPFRDDDGSWYLFYARNFTNYDASVHPGTAIVVDRLIDMTRLAGDCHEVIRAKHDWTLYEAHRTMEVYNATFDWHTIEGPCVIKHQGKYYCFFSGSNYQTARYGVDYVVADHPMGPYGGEGEGPRVMRTVGNRVRGPGHHSIVQGPHGRTQYFVYHAWEPRMKFRWLCIDKLIWTPDGPRCEGPTFTPQHLP